MLAFFLVNFWKYSLIFFWLNIKKIGILTGVANPYIFPYFKIAYFPSAKSEKSKKLNFFVPIVCTPKKIFMRQLFDVMLFSKKFFMIFWNVLGTKFLSQKFFFRKKGWTTEMSKKKKTKKWKMADFRKSAGIWVQYLGGLFLGIRGNFCKKNYMIWVLNAFCLHQKFVSIILT